MTSDLKLAVPMAGVREYAEQYPVELELVAPNPLVPEYGPPATEGARWCVLAWNEARHNATRVDVLDLLAWLRENRPDLLVMAGIK